MSSREVRWALWLEILSLREKAASRAEKGLGRVLILPFWCSLPRILPTFLLVAATRRGQSNENDIASPAPFGEAPCPSQGVFPLLPRLLRCLLLLFANPRAPLAHNAAGLRARGLSHLDQAALAARAVALIGWARTPASHTATDWYALVCFGVLFCFWC